jgi:hypothetical protein
MSVLKPGHQYIGGCGERARQRYLRQAYRRAENLKDEASKAALARVRASVAHEPDPEAGAMQLVLAAWTAAEGVTRGDPKRGIPPTPCTWAQAMNHLLDRFEARAGAAQ